MADPRTEVGFDRAAAVTRSMLGWGVVAGPFYVVVGVVLALSRPGFDLTQDALSLLILGDLGWVQWLNLVLSGLMSVVAAAGLLRTPGRPRAAAVLVGVYGVCLVLSAVFPPDATDSYPPGTDAGGEVSTSGLLHLGFGALGFLCMAVAAVLAGSWLARRRPPLARWSRLAGVAILVSFVAGAALSQGPAGIALIWLAVLVTWGWLAAVSAVSYRSIPHPDLDRRPAAHR